MRIVADARLRSHGGFVIPALRRGAFYRNVAPVRDFRVDDFADIASAEAGDACLACRAPLRALNGVEVGHLFKLGTRFARRSERT